MVSTSVEKRHTKFQMLGRGPIMCLQIGIIIRGRMVDG